MAVIQVIPTVSPSICHLRMKISGKKKGKMEVIMMSCTLIRVFHTHLLGNLCVSDTGNWEKNKRSLPSWS